MCSPNGFRGMNVTQIFRDVGVSCGFDENPRATELLKPFAPFYIPDSVDCVGPGAVIDQISCTVALAPYRRLCPCVYQAGD